MGRFFEPRNGVCQAVNGIKECGQAGLMEWGPSHQETGYVAVSPGSGQQSGVHMKD